MTVKRVGLGHTVNRCSTRTCAAAPEQLLAFSIIMSKSLVLGAPLCATLLLTPFQDAFAQADQNAGVTPSTTTADAENTPAPGEKDEGNTLDAVVVQGTGVYDARREDTVSRIIVTQEDLRKFGDTELSESIKRLPGVTVGIGPAGRSGAITLRGMGNGYTQILLNGEKAPEGFTVDSISPEMVERIEIQRSATADRSAEAIAGTINIVMKKGSRKRTRDIKLTLSSLRGKLSPAFNWQFSDQRDDLSYALNGAVSRRDFLVTETERLIARDAAGDTQSIRNGDIHVTGRTDALSISPSLSMRLENGDTLSLQGFVDASEFNKHGDIDYEMELGLPVRHMRYRQTIDTDDLRLRGDLNWTHTFDNDNLDQLAIKLSLNSNRQDYRFQELGYAADGIQNLDDDTNAQIREHGLNTTGKYSAGLFENHSLQLGWDGTAQRRDERRVQRLADLPGIPGSVSDLDFDASINRIAFYAQDDWTVSERWSLYLGARWELFETISEGNSFARIRNSDQVLSPSFQSLWKLSSDKKDQVRLALSRTYNSPRIAQLIPRPYTTTNNNPLEPDQRGNPGLKPELATGLDLSYEHYWADDAMLSLGTYVRRIEDVIRDEIRFVGGRWSSSPNNGGKALAWGIEMDSKFPLNSLIARAPDIDVRFNLTRNWSRVDDIPGPDNRLPDQAKLSSTLAVDYKVNPAWTVGGSFTYQDGGYIRTTLSQARFSAPRREFDVYGLWSAGARSKLRLSIGNLLLRDIVSGNEYFDDFGSNEIIRRRDTSLLFRATFEFKF